MFVVYQWDKYEREWSHKYFKHKENAEAYVRKLQEGDRWIYMEIIEIQTED